MALSSSSPLTGSRISYLQFSPPASPYRGEMPSERVSSAPSSPVAPVMSSRSSIPVSSSAQLLSTTPEPSLPALLSSVDSSTHAVRGGDIFVLSFSCHFFTFDDSYVGSGWRSKTSRRLPILAVSQGNTAVVRPRIPRSVGPQASRSAPGTTSA